VTAAAEASGGRPGRPQAPPAQERRPQAQRRPQDDQPEGRHPLQRPGHRVRRAVQAVRRRPHPGGVPQDGRRRQRTSSS
jgi:hypothetical protein